MAKYITTKSSMIDLVHLHPLILHSVILKWPSPKHLKALRKLYCYLYPEHTACIKCNGPYVLDYKLQQIITLFQYQFG